MSYQIFLVEWVRLILYSIVISVSCVHLIQRTYNFYVAIANIFFATYLIIALYEKLAFGTRNISTLFTPFAFIWAIAHILSLFKHGRPSKKQDN